MAILKKERMTQNKKKYSYKKTKKNNVVTQWFNFFVFCFHFSSNVFHFFHFFRSSFIMSTATGEKNDKKKSKLSKNN